MRAPRGWRHSEQERLVHPQLGELQLHCQSLLDPEQAQTLLVFTAVPGSESHEKLQLLSALAPGGRAPDAPRTPRRVTVAPPRRLAASWWPSPQEVARDASRAPRPAVGQRSRLARGDGAAVGLER
ncbi:hypothetical protein GTQ99_16275 [Kineococcus sp. T13]|nr:hypothetical protein [Kineococcus vitellinus]